MTKLIKGRVRRIEEVRRRNALLAVSLAVVCFVLSGCADTRSGTTTTSAEQPSASRGEPRLPSAEADIHRIITEAGRIAEETDSVRGTAERIGGVLIEENPDEKSGSQKDSVSVTRATKLFERRGRDLTPIAFDNLKAGKRAKAWYTGPVAESYPRQATAKVIVVYPDSGEQRKTTASQTAGPEETSVLAHPPESTASTDPELTTTPAASNDQSTEEIEAEAEEAAEDYYRAAGSEDWAYTYQHLDSETQSRFTREEWFKKNQWFADNGFVIYDIESVERLGTSSELVVGVTLRLTYEDGSSSTRNTYFVYEDGGWKHAFGQEEYDLFMPDLSYEEFVEAQGGSSSASPEGQQSVPPFPEDTNGGAGEEI